MATIKSINLKFPLRRSSAGAFETNVTTIAAVTDDLKILILTNFGERPMQYDFGANLRSVVFEQRRWFG
jgi:phage baseplate assembly protein W